MATKGRKKLSLIVGLASYAVACLALTGCNPESKTIDFDKTMQLLAQVDPNTLGKVTETLFTEQMKHDLAEIKIKAEAKAYERQEGWKIKLVIGAGACVVIVFAGIWFGQKMIIALGVAGFLGCGTSWGLIFAGLEQARLIGTSVAYLCLGFGVLIFGLFVYSVFKYRKQIANKLFKTEKAVKEIVLSVEEAKKIEPAVIEAMKTIKASDNIQSCDTEKIVDKIKNGSG